MTEEELLKGLEGLAPPEEKPEPETTATRPLSRIGRFRRPGIVRAVRFRQPSRKRVAGSANSRGILCRRPRGMRRGGRGIAWPAPDRSAAHAEPAAGAAGWSSLRRRSRRRSTSRRSAQAADDAAVRAGRAGQELQSERQRGPAQPRLCLRHEGARHAEARLGRPLFLPSARSRRDPDRPQARRRDDRGRAAARHDRGHRRDARRDRRAVRAARSARWSTA